MRFDMEVGLFSFPHPKALQFSESTDRDDLLKAVLLYENYVMQTGPEILRRIELAKTFNPAIAAEKVQELIELRSLVRQQGTIIGDLQRQLKCSDEKRAYHQKVSNGRRVKLQSLKERIGILEVSQPIEGLKEIYEQPGHPSI